MERNDECHESQDIGTVFRLPQRTSQPWSSRLESKSETTSLRAVCIERCMHGSEGGVAQSRTDSALLPYHIEVEIAGEDEEQKALYQLIRMRTLACILADAIYASRVTKLQAELDGKIAEFVGRSRSLVNAGWKMLMESDQTDEPDEEDTESKNPIPELKTGEKVSAHDGAILTKKTKPPKRYTEASLVKELERRGIGRPATYAAILENIITTHEYVREEKRFLKPTKYGVAVVDNLVGHFSFVDYEFTRTMESGLDEIAEGRCKYKDLITKMYGALTDELSAFKKATGIPCPKCGKFLRHKVKTGENGWNFWGCEGYPECDANYPDKDGKPDFEAQSAKTGGACPCGKGELRLKKGANGAFWGCSEYPNCKNTFPDKDRSPDFNATKQAPASSIHKCMECGRPLIRQQNKKDKSAFWGCSGYKSGECKKTYRDINGKPNYAG